MHDIHGAEHGRGQRPSHTHVQRRRHGPSGGAIHDAAATTTTTTTSTTTTNLDAALDAVPNTAPNATPSLPLPITAACSWPSRLPCFPGRHHR